MQRGGEGEGRVTVTTMPDARAQMPRGTLTEAVETCPQARVKNNPLGFSGRLSPGQWLCFLQQ